MEDHHPSANEKQDEKDLTSRAITPQTADGSGLQAVISRVRERYAKRILPRPEDRVCERCLEHFSPTWDYSRQKWDYPGMGEEGLCKRCKGLQHRRENIEEYLEKAGVHLRYLHCSFENFKVTKQNQQVYEVCREYIANPTYSLYLYGTCGTGKTHLAVAITRELLVQGKQIMFTFLPRLFFDIRKTFRDGIGQSERDFIQHYVTCGYLVLDDFGVEKCTDWVRQTLNFIISERDNNFEPTLITSNISLDEVAIRIDDRISSRIAGMGKVVHVSGPDWRLKRSVLRVF